ncbi:MAG: cytochrome c biogenesis CcdA family protein [Nocardioides sp.]|uniref:cytochrome c biogenesis CcdA family protein n=1 Tax=Nocardioides nematodiphilus TaxID=2849669 RepID=UPI001CDA50AD|nr:cytochrome c biogenesis CcdA family protein [Nocardioides nematodiphilus]MCA1981565.1 cytochrome c biogenesis CcdA family protein [Nocardioides nematodiphilus]
MSNWFSDTAGSGSMVLAVPVAVVAGLASFLSPCVLPMLPGYLSYATGLSGAELASGDVRRSRMLLGSVLFVLGFSVVFVALGVATGSLGYWYLEHQVLIDRILGVFTIVMGLAFLGVLPWFQRDLRVHKVPAVGLAAAPLLGFLFGLGWAPCVGPTLGVIDGLAATSGTAARGGVLLAFYSLGLGLPFILFAVLWRRALGALTFLRRHQRWVTRIGGVMLILVGLALLTGWWQYALDWLQIHLVDHWSGVTL